MDFMKNLEEKSTETTTENGALAFNTTLNKNLDFFGQAASMRGNNDVQNLFIYAYNEDRTLALKNLVYLRDIRHGGLGERDSFRLCAEYLNEIEDNPALLGVLNKLHDFGRWDDVFYFADNFNEEISERAFRIIKDQLSEDTFSLLLGKEISLLAKWLPNGNEAKESRRLFGRKMQKELEMTPSKYRKTISMLRKELDLVEIKLASKQTDKIDYSSVPSLANLKYHKAFSRNDGDRYSDFLTEVISGESTMNSSLNMPGDIIHKYHGSDGSSYWGFSYKPSPTMEAAWISMNDVFQEEDKSDSIIVVADTSGSMNEEIGSSSMTLWDVAEGLGIYTAERLGGPFENKLITFSSKPIFVNLPKNGTLYDKMREYERHSIIDNTNIEKVFRLILDTAVQSKAKQEDIPNKILIVSDMQFDYMVDNPDNTKSILRAFQDKFRLFGYELPQIVFWNLNRDSGRLPIQASDSGVALASGYSTNVLLQILGNNDLSPVQLMLDSLANPYFDFVDEL